MNARNPALRIALSLLILSLAGPILSAAHAPGTGAGGSPAPGPPTARSSPAPFHPLPAQGGDPAAAVGAMSASGWITETVVKDGRVSWYSSMDVDSAGNPHIAYQDAPSDSLRYAHFDGAAWVFETVDTLGSGGLHPSLAVDAADHPHIVHVGDTLKYTWHDGASWHTEVIEDIDEARVFWRPNLVLDAAGRPHVGYSSYGWVKHAWREGDAWHIDYVEPGGYFGVSIALDAAGHPHMAYGAEFPLRYARYDGSAWHIETVAPSGVFSSIALDSAGHPYIAYLSPPYWVSLARFDGASWQTETLGISDSGRYTVVVLDQAERPHVAYCYGWPSTGCEELRYVWYDGNAWETHTVDSNRSGESLSLSLDSTGLPHIGYNGSPGPALRYARPACLPVDGASLSGPVRLPTGHTGLYTATIAPPSTTLPLVRWNNGAVGPTAAYSWTTPGHYTVSLTATNPCGGPIRVSQSVLVFTQTLEGVELIGPAALPIAVAGVYAGSPVPPTASLPVTFTWDNGVTGPTTSYSWTTGGVHSLTVTATNPFAQVACTFPVSVFCQPVLHVQIEGPAQLFDREIGGFRAEARPITATAPFTFTWDNGAIGPSSTYSWPTSGVHTIVVTAVNPCGEGYGTLPVSVTRLLWQTETVDASCEDVGTFTSLALDGEDLPHIVYRNNTSQDLKYARYDGSSWHIEVVDSADRVGAHASLALDAAGHPHVSYYDGTNTDLKYAHHDGTGWHFEVVDSSGDVGQFSSLALDDAGHPHISYYDATNTDLKYAHHDGVEWHTETVLVSTRDLGRYSSLALDSQGRPRIACMDEHQYDSGIFYFSFNGATWEVDQVGRCYADECSLGQHSSLELDSNDRPHISHRKENTHYGPYGSVVVVNAVECAHSPANGTPWSYEWLFSTRVCHGSMYTSLALDREDQPHVAYTDCENEDLAYAWRKGDTWLDRVVDSVGRVGTHVSLALDSLDWAHISYYDATNGDLKYARQCSALEQLNLRGPLALRTGLTGTYSIDPGPGRVSRPIRLLWDNGVTGTVAQYRWDITGTYTVTVAATNPCGQAQEHLNVVVLDHWPYDFFLPLVPRGSDGAADQAHR